MKEKIGETAGKIWTVLGENGELGISDIPRKLKEKTDVVYQALGWLAREDKITYARRKNAIVVSLSDHERAMFHHAH